MLIVYDLTSCLCVSFFVCDIEWLREFGVSETSRQRTADARCRR